MHSLSAGDDFTLSGYEEYTTLENPTECDITDDDFDTDFPGTYFVEYSVKDAADNEDNFYVVVMVLSDYYDDAVGLSGDDLLLSLRTIINTDVQRKSYEDAKTILQESDCDPNNEDNVILIYLGTSVPGQWDAGTTWNREHIWPQSRMEGVYRADDDLHNLKPANPSENSSRGNKYFSDVKTTETYAPREEVRGDIARILFYMTLMYEELELVNTAPDGNQMALLDVLIEWHNDDQVDDFETNRNDVIYGYQNNRNPFIDYPFFYELIYNSELLIWQ